MKTRTLAAAVLSGLLLAPITAQAGPSQPLPASEQYSDVFDYTVDWGDDTYTLDATGMPADITFTDNGDGTGHLGGVVEVPAGVYDIDLTATTTGDVTYHKTLELTVLHERALVGMASTNPTRVSRTRSFVLKARVKDQDDGSFGDITLAEPGAFQLDRNGHVRTCDATMVPGSLHTGTGPDYYDVKCRVPAGLHRGTYAVTYSVAGDYYLGSRTSSLRITR